LFCRLDLTEVRRTREQRVEVQTIGYSVNPSQVEALLQKRPGRAATQPRRSARSNGWPSHRSTYDVGTTTFLIRHFDPSEDAIAYGKSLLQLTHWRLSEKQDVQAHAPPSV
jgi:hypothetical protein